MPKDSLRMNQLPFRPQPTLDMGPRRGRVGLDQLRGSSACRLDERAVACEIGETEQRIPALPLADVLARPAQIQVMPRDLVCRLLLEKKKKHYYHTVSRDTH